MRLDFGINISGKSGERKLEQEVEGGVPYLKRKISDVVSFEEDSDSVSPGEKTVRRSARFVVKALEALLVKEKMTIYFSA